MKKLILFCTMFLLTTIVLSLFFEYTETWAGNYGTGGAFALLFVNIAIVSLPFLGFWLTGRITSGLPISVKNNVAKLMLFVGLLIWVGIAVLLVDLQSSQTSEGTFKHIMWYVFGAFMFLLPSSVKILRDSGSFSTQWSRSAAIATVVLSIFSIVLPKIVTGLQLGGYGPYMGYGFCLLLLALYVALIGEINKVLTGVAVLAVIAVGGYYTFVVFFLGSFYNGGMGSHLFFLSALVVGTFFCGFRFERLHKMSG